MHSKLIYLLAIVSFVFFGYDQGNQTFKKESGHNDAISQDSVLFSIDRAAYEVTFSKIGRSGHGSAEGKSLFQRMGSLKFIFSELYVPKPVKILDSPYRRTKFKVEVTWSDEVRFEDIKKDVLEHMADRLNYIVRSDTISQTSFLLGIADFQKLKKASEEDMVEEGVEFKSETEDGQWLVYATIDKLAEELESRTGYRISTQNSDTTPYSFNLSLQDGFNGLKNQLESQYGILLNKKSVPTERVIIDFND